MFGKKANHLIKNMFRTDILEQSSLEYLWSLTDRGILRAKEMDGKWEFMLSPNYIDMKDKLFRDFMDRMEILAEFYVNNKATLTDQA